MQDSPSRAPKLVELTTANPPGIDPRRVQLWVDDDWDNAPGRSLLIMHDGQNLFREQDAHYGIWGIVPAIRRLRSLKAIPPTAVAGVWNSGENRWLDYMPMIHPSESRQWQAVMAEHKALGELPRSTVYGDYIVSSVIPAAREHVGAGTGDCRIHTMGSSMGGLISLDLFIRYPEIFRGAGCLSTHWSAGGNRMIDYVKNGLSPWKGSDGRKLYFDFGNSGLDGDYEQYQNQLDGHLISRGMTYGTDFLSHRFPGAEHSEGDWRMRLEVPLRFLLSS